MRRPRSAINKPIWCGHVIAGDGVGNASCETDRAVFVGRGRTVRNPAAMDKDGGLPGTTGAVLDPVFAIRSRLTIPPGESREVTFTTYMAEDRTTAIALAARYSETGKVEASIAPARSNERELLRSLEVDSADAEKYQMLAGDFLFPREASRSLTFSTNLTLRRTQKGKPSDTSREFPVLFAVVRSQKGLQSLTDAVNAHRYWQAKGIASDLIILADSSGGNHQRLVNQIAAALTEARESLPSGETGGVFVLRSDELTTADIAMLDAVARMRIDCDEQDIEDLIGSFVSGDAPIAAHTSAKRSFAGSAPTSQGESLAFFNGIGGFNAANEYEIRLAGETLPPAPWINVVANASGGFIASETGAGPAWAINSSLFRLTPWHNDPVSDRVSECIYIRDDDTNDLWSATAAPIREATSYTVRHGAGYSIFEHEHDGIVSSLRMGVPVDDPVKLQVLTLRNDSGRARRLTITSYAEWVLGGNRDVTRLHVRTSYDSKREVMLARNPLDSDLATQCAFCAMSERITAHTSSRGEFLGRNGAYDSPAWLAAASESLANEYDPDPCSALATTIELQPGETKDIAVVLGCADGASTALEMADRYRRPESANAAIDASAAAWQARLSAVKVKTPEPSLDLMLNQWAFYQALSCRVWGRIALFQSSGAFGFRDQLQDVGAFVYAEPGLAREQIIRAASRQFEEGDVQHWWHPHNGKGIRTRFADDLVWLPLILDHYLRTTHDFSILDEETPYLSMRTLEPDEEELFAVPDTSEIRKSIFDHCVHALNRATTAGAHGLPLMRSGDWNDGMNRVGVEGKGESVWLGWFFIDTLRRFAAYADARDHAETAKSFREKADAYKHAIEESAWDGEWYCRAYYDDGTPLGSHVNTECQIDSIAQSWSVISRAGDPERSRTAMESLNRRLVREDARLIMLLTPPFDRGTHDPGYIQGYLPGVRENGAQYTHAALWAVLATAMQGDGDRAMHLYQMINPITHADSPAGVATYKVEPYVVAADVYTAEGHVGRGGWTWYTGSASWLYRVGLEAILGFTKRGETIEVNPCIPSSWKEFSIEYRFGESSYSILVRNPSGVQKGVVSIVADGTRAEGVIHLFNDGQRHEVIVTMGHV
jgi:cyclic beta-1,2-glucan synthetase